MRVLASKRSTFDNMEYQQKVQISYKVNDDMTIT